MKKARVFSSGEIRAYILLVNFTLSILFSACTPQDRLPEGPTPIPTLIPVTSQPSILRPTDVPSLVIESFPAGLPTALNGQRLYNEQCASCHGIDGNGLVPNARNFGDVDYMRGETPAEFYVITTEGRGPEMPGFGEQLSSDERWAVVYYVWRFSTSKEFLHEGSEIYQDHCASCHGEDGRSLILGAANFPDQRFMANQSPSNLYVSVTQGMGSMPAWQARLSQDERWSVIDYIRTFSYDPNLGEDSETATIVSTSIEEIRSECAPYQEIDNPFGWENAGVAAEGQILYSANCSSCHGEDGSGRLPGILDFTDPMTQAELRSNTAVYFCGLAEGLRSMPPFKDKLNENEMWQILVWMSKLGE